MGVTTKTSNIYRYSYSEICPLFIAPNHLLLHTSFKINISHVKNASLPPILYNQYMSTTTSSQREEGTTNSEISTTKQ